LLRRLDPDLRPAADPGWSTEGAKHDPYKQGPESERDRHEAVEAARTDLIARGVDVSEVFHRGPQGRISGPDPERPSYGSLATFSDPDGNVWLIQQVTQRLPGRVSGDQTTFTSSSDLAAALRRTAAAHGEHEKRTGGHDPNWPDWYAEYIVREQTGQQLPD
jgi:hypothetical protein